MEVRFFQVCAGVRHMIDIFYRKAFIEMNLNTLEILVLIKTILLHVENVLGNTKQKTASQNSLSA